MKTHGDSKPDIPFTVEPIPNKPGYCLARFYEHARSYTDGEDTGWVYDEYHLTLPNIGNLAADIAGNYSVYLEAAKLNERDMSPENLFNLAKDAAKKVAVAELAEANAESITALQLAIAELAEAMEGGDHNG